MIVKPESGMPNAAVSGMLGKHYDSIMSRAEDPTVTTDQASADARTERDAICRAWDDGLNTLRL